MERRNLALLCAGVLCFWLFALAFGTAEGRGVAVQAELPTAAPAAVEDVPVVDAAAQPQLSLNCRAAILVDQDTGTVLYEKNADEQVPIASITKVMTLLLTFEAIHNGQLTLETTVPVSEHAYHMGGSQIWLEPGEQFTLDEMIKAICVSSANDAAVAVAELVGGSEPVFVESPIILFASIIWYLKIYQNGKYCTFPHAIEFLNRRYEDIFPILTSYPELENYLSPFMDAWLGGAAEQLMGQIASAKIPLSRMISPQLYWVMSDSEFTLDINNPEEPKILCVGNNPDRQNIYGAALGLYNSRIVKLINKKGMLKSSVIIDELPTIYFKGLDNLIATARSNKVAVCLGFQPAGARLR